MYTKIYVETLKKISEILEIIDLQETDINWSTVNCF